MMPPCRSGELGDQPDRWFYTQGYEGTGGVSAAAGDRGAEPCDRVSTCYIKMTFE